MSMLYTVINFRTAQVMGRYATRKRASRRADALDLAYGAITTTVRLLPSPKESQ